MPAASPKSVQFKVKLYKMGEFCCNIVANFVKGLCCTEVPSIFSVGHCPSIYVTAQPVRRDFFVFLKVAVDSFIMQNGAFDWDPVQHGATRACV